MHEFCIINLCISSMETPFSMYVIFLVSVLQVLSNKFEELSIAHGTKVKQLEALSEL